MYDSINICNYNNIMVNNKNTFYAYIRKDFNNDNNYFKLEDGYYIQSDKSFINITTNAKKTNATIFKFILEGDGYVIYVKDTDLQFVHMNKFNMNDLIKIIDSGGGICDMNKTSLSHDGFLFTCRKHWIIKQADNNNNINNFNWNCYDNIRLVNKSDFYMINKDGNIIYSKNCSTNISYHLTLDYIKPVKLQLKDSNEYINYEIIITKSSNQHVNWFDKIDNYYRTRIYGAEQYLSYNDNNYILVNTKEQVNRNFNLIEEPIPNSPNVVKLKDSDEYLNYEIIITTSSNENVNWFDDFNGYYITRFYMNQQYLSHDGTNYILVNTKEEVSNKMQNNKPREIVVEL